MQVKIPPQILRLLLLTAVIAILFWGAKALLVPASFGQYGWYRGDALKTIASLAPTFAGQEACKECHEDVFKRKAGNKHAGINCESCHGANALHAENPTTLPDKITDPRFCLRCHAKDFTRPNKFPQVDASDHAGKDGCRTCHIAHTPTEAPAK